MGPPSYSWIPQNPDGLGRVASRQACARYRTRSPGVSILFITPLSSSAAGRPEDKFPKGRAVSTCLKCEDLRPGPSASVAEDSQVPFDKSALGSCASCAAFAVL